MRTFLSVLLGAAMLASCTTTTQASKSYSRTFQIHRDYGGYVLDYEIKKEEYKRTNVYIEFMGNCESACTMYLGLPKDRICVGPNAKFGFHRPYVEGRNDPIQDKKAEAWLIKRYPKWVRKWIKSTGGLKKDIVYIPDSIVRENVRACDTTEHYVIPKI